MNENTKIKGEVTILIRGGDVKAQVELGRKGRIHEDPEEEAAVLPSEGRCTEAAVPMDGFPSAARTFELLLTDHLPQTCGYIRLWHPHVASACVIFSSLQMKTYEFLEKLRNCLT